MATLKQLKEILQTQLTAKSLDTAHKLIGALKHVGLQSKHDVKPIADKPKIPTDIHVKTLGSLKIKVPVPKTTAIH